MTHDDDDPAVKIFGAIESSGLREMSGQPEVMLNRAVIISEWVGFGDERWISIVAAGGAHGEKGLTRWDVRALLQEADLKQTIDAFKEE